MPFRVFLSAVLFSVIPWGAFGLLVILYIVNLGVYRSTSLGGWKVAAVAAYASIFAPSGYSKNHGHHSSIIQKQQLKGSLLRRSSGARGRTTAALTLSQPYSEVERAKINQESLLFRVRIGYGTFVITSVLLLVRLALFILIHNLLR